MRLKVESMQIMNKNRNETLTLIRYITANTYHQIKLMGVQFLVDRVIEAQLQHRMFDWRREELVRSQNKKNVPIVFLQRGGFLHLQLQARTACVNACV